MALQVGHPSRRYDTAFGTTQARTSTVVWAIALQFCRTEGRDLSSPSQLRQCLGDRCENADAGDRSRRHRRSDGRRREHLQRSRRRRPTVRGPKKLHGQIDGSRGSGSPWWLSR